MDQISGLPAHPLLVHIPVALLPLAFVGVVVMLIRRAWYERYRWAVLAIGAIGTLGAILAASSGESLQGQIRRQEGAAAARRIGDHAEAGNLAETLTIVFFVALAAYVLVPWFLDRRVAAARSTEVGAAAAASSKSGPSWLRPALMVIVAVTAAASMVSIVGAGHSGASEAWKELKTQTSGG